MMSKLSGVNSDKVLELALNEAKEICEEDIKFCENIGLNGLKIIEEIYNKKKIQLIYLLIVTQVGLRQLIGEQQLLPFITLIKKEFQFMFGLMKQGQETKGLILLLTN